MPENAKKLAYRVRKTNCESEENEKKSWSHIKYRQEISQQICIWDLIWDI